MARQRSPARDAARALWEQDRERTLKSIAEELGVGENRVRKWKCEDKWEKGNVPNKAKKERSVSKATARKLIASVEQNEELTDKQRAFCLYYAKSFNATQAYIHAFGSSYDVANAEGYKMLVKPCVREEVKRLKEIRHEAMLASGDDVVELHMRIAFADMKEFSTWGAAGVRVNPSGMVDGQLVAEVSYGQYGTSIKLVDRQKSLAFLERYFELNPMDRHKRDYDNARLEMERQKQGQDAVEGVQIVDEL